MQPLLSGSIAFGRQIGKPWLGISHPISITLTHGEHTGRRMAGCAREMGFPASMAGKRSPPPFRLHPKPPCAPLSFSLSQDLSRLGARVPLQGWSSNEGASVQSRGAVSRVLESLLMIRMIAFRLCALKFEVADQGLSLPFLSALRLSFGP